MLEIYLILAAISKSFMLLFMFVSLLFLIYTSLVMMSMPNDYKNKHPKLVIMGFLIIIFGVSLIEFINAG